jgi:superfamily II DNA or RNA helicase
MSIGLLEKPRLGECKVNLWPYQLEAVAACRAAFARGDRSTLLILPTGCGKTITFGMITRLTIQKGGRVLILAHRSELIQQAASKLDLLGVEAQVEQAGSYARSIWEPDCVVASVQTMRGKRLESWPRDYFRLIITDEAHHATADSYTAITRHFNSARHLGVTATADRADEDELSDIFQSVAYEYSLWDAMKSEYPGPYLCRLTFAQCDLQIDLRGLRKGKEDYTTADLEARITPLVDAIANAVRQEIGERKTIIFTPDVASTMALATALRSIGLEADYVYGDDPARDGKIAKLRAGESQVIVNCALLTEGFDCPDISAIVLCRPTKSRPLYAQMIGRGTRIAPGKTDCLIVDFDFLTDKHDLVKPTDLFDGTHGDTEVLDIAMELALKDKQLPLDVAIERGEQIKRERALVRVRARQREVRYRKVSYDPLAVYDTLGLPWRGQKNADAISNRATEGQVRYLKNLGVENADSISRGRAKTLIDYLAARRAKGLATAKQVAWLIAKGTDPTDARTMTFDAARAALDQLFNERTPIAKI